jgi:hypothetical protein
MLPVKRSCNTQLHISKVYMSFVNNLHLHFQESKFTFLEKERERERDPTSQWNSGNPKQSYRSMESAFTCRHLKNIST